MVASPRVPAGILLPMNSERSAGREDATDASERRTAVSSPGHPGGAALDRQFEASTTVIEAMARTEAILARQSARQQLPRAPAAPSPARPLKRWLDALSLRFRRSDDPAT